MKNSGHYLWLMGVWQCRLQDLAFGLAHSCFHDRFISLAVAPECAFHGDREARFRVNSELIKALIIVFTTIISSQPWLSAVLLAGWDRLFLIFAA